MEKCKILRDSITVGFMNIKGQSRLNIEKQIQIEDFLRKYNCDILNLQETNIETETFSTCNFMQFKGHPYLLQRQCSYSTQAGNAAVTRTIFWELPSTPTALSHIGL